MDSESEDVSESLASLSERLGVRTPSLLYSDENERRNTQPGPSEGKARRGVLQRYVILKILSFPLRPLLRTKKGTRRDIEPETSSNDPVEPWKARVASLKTELSRLTTQHNYLRRDYAAVHEHATYAEERYKKAECKFDKLRDAHEDLSRVVYERYGREEFRKLREKIEEDKREVARKRFVASTSMLVINTKDTDEEA